MVSERSIRWCFTLNNPTGEDVVAIEGLCDSGVCTYVGFGREVGANGTPHLQGYLEFTKKKTLGGIRQARYWFARAHWEVARGTPKENITYCSKDGEFRSFGCVSQQGARTDIKRFVDEVKAGSSLREVALRNPELYCRYRGGLRDLANWSDVSGRKQPRIIYIWGPPGTGKSKYAFGSDSESCWSYPGNGWFDGYDGQRTVIFDDFDDDQNPIKGMSIGLMLKILDRYPMDVAVKGGFVKWRPEKIIITSNRRFEHLYSNCQPSQHAALSRRVKECDRWLFD